MAALGKWDFFVSYAKDDRVWAEWVAWTLEAAGYRVLIQAWDMVPGTNWVFTVQEGMRRAERTIAVASGAYLRSEWAQLEALGAVHRDPSGRDRRLLVARIEDCRPEGPLGMITRIDIFGLPERDARRALLDGVARAIRGRGKPPAAGSFPGRGRAARFPRGTSPGAGEERISLALEIEGYGQMASGRRERVRTRVLGMLFTALDRAGVQNSACAVIDRVDGLAVILPAGVTGPAATAMLVSELRGGIAALGRAAGGQPPVQCRAGVAAGTVDMMSWTFEGTSTATARLLVTCGQARIATARSGRTPNAVIVADDLYQAADPAGLPAGFTRIPVSEGNDGWITLISGTVPPACPAPGQPDAAVAGAVAAGAVAATITGGLAAREWDQILGREQGAAGEDILVAAPDEDRAPGGQDTGSEDDPFSPEGGAAEDLQDEAALYDDGALMDDSDLRDLDHDGGFDDGF